MSSIDISDYKAKFVTQDTLVQPLVKPRRPFFKDVNNNSNKGANDIHTQTLILY